MDTELGGGLGSIAIGMGLSFDDLAGADGMQRQRSTITHQLSNISQTNYQNYKDSPIRQVRTIFNSLTLFKQLDEANEKAIDDFMKSPRGNARKSVLPTTTASNSGSFLANRNSSSAVAPREK